MIEAVNNLRSIRRQRNLTQADLAARCSTHKNIISRLETGKMKFTLEWMEKLAQILEVNKWEFVDDDIPTNPYVKLSRLFFADGSNEVNGENIPRPYGLETHEGIWAYKMIDNSMEQIIPKGSIMLAADPDLHDLPMEVNTVVFFRLKEQVYVRQYIVTDDQAYLMACPMQFDPSLRSFVLDRNRHGRKSHGNTVNIRDIFAVLWWVYQDHIASLV